MKMNCNIIEPSQWFEQNGIKEYEIVMSNPRKGRQCYCYWDTNGTRCFLKWNDDEELHSNHKKLMQKEKWIYQLLQLTEIAPKYICGEWNISGEMFVTEYVEEGETMRRVIKKLLKSQDITIAVELLRDMFYKWELFCKTIKPHSCVIENTPTEFIFNHYLMSLFFFWTNRNSKE